MGLADFIIRLMEKAAYQKAIYNHKGQDQKQDECPQIIENEGAKANENTDDPQSTLDPIDDPPFEDQTGEFVSFNKIIGKESFLKKPINIKEEGFTTKRVFTKETEQGLEREVETPLITGPTGWVIKASEIVIKCSVCKQYEGIQNSFACSTCGKAICRLHTFF